MIKYFCDACGKEMGMVKIYCFNYWVHIEKPSGYEDREGNEVSGKQIEREVCVSCYNRIMGKAMEEFKAIRGDKSDG